MFRDDTDKIYLIGAVIVVLVIIAVARMLPSWLTPSTVNAAARSPMMGAAGAVPATAGATAGATPNTGPGTTGTPVMGRFSAQTSWPVFSGAVSGPDGHDVTWIPPVMEGQPSPGRAVHALSPALTTAGSTAPGALTAPGGFTAPGLPVFLPPTEITMPLGPPLSSPTVEGGTSISAGGPQYAGELTPGRDWRQMGTDSPLWVTSVSLEPRGTHLGGIPVVGALSGAPGVWILDVTIYNTSSSPYLVMPGRLEFGDGSQESLFPWSGQFAAMSPSGGRSRTSGTEDIAAVTPLPDGASAVVARPMALTTLHVFAENGGAYSRHGNSGNSADLSTVRTRRPKALVFLLAERSAGDDLDRSPIADRLTHLVNLVHTTEASDPDHARELRVSLTSDGLPPFPQ